MIELLGFPLLKSAGGDYRLGRMFLIEKWPNDYFDERLDIFSEKEWAKFIIDYRKHGKSLPKVDDKGDKIMYVIFNRGVLRYVSEFFGRHPHEGSYYYLFPQTKSMDKDDKTEPMRTYNKKYIWPYLG